MTVFRILAGLALLAFSPAVVAQTSSLPKAYSSPTTIVVSTIGTSIIEVQATGTANGLNFSVQGMPFATGSSTWVPLAMVVPSTCASVANSTTNGDWLISTAGFTSVRINLVNVIGTETIGINSSPSSNVLNNCASQAAAGSATADNQTNVQASPGSSASVANAVQGITNGLPIIVSTPRGAPHTLDATSLSGSAATTALTAGHALFGAMISVNSVSCINYGGSIAGTTADAQGTVCNSANQPYYVPPTLNPVSINSNSPATISGSGQY